jgi:heptosyltransferase-2
LKRILVIRGGAIGDFILTLPAVKLLRDNFPNAHIEILGYKRIVALAEKRFYGNATRSIDYAPLSRFFARDSELAPELVTYFASFELILSYLFDPDEIFATNLKRCGVRRLIAGSPKINEGEHAADQLAKPLRELGLTLLDRSAILYPNESDRQAAAEFLGQDKAPIVAIHPGSGSETKNWPIENWIALADRLLRVGGTFVVVGGEADEKQISHLWELWTDKPAVRFALNLPLPHLAAILEDAVFVGHDSGISHLAAAAGANCVLLFGPTDPAVWAPANENVKVFRAPDGDLRKLPVAEVLAALGHPERSNDLARNSTCRNS